eukprot:CAMPEP_0184694662 /NCGR_PEP_ID=MMETSP0313-20130426/2541_1 /TAXON_ID=2792 /ORGANISM="Porphyridium aerugineum, Strain SAG 1380-2" /LENGTH=335 /DNA_ID=CAMNT_0027152987 /DNA_START=445 /DNA_END=1452 /DNA_ORIENTATION=+
MTSSLSAANSNQGLLESRRLRWSPPPGKELNTSFQTNTLEAILSPTAKVSITANAVGNPATKDGQVAKLSNSEEQSFCFAKNKKSSELGELPKLGDRGEIDAVARTRTHHGYTNLRNSFSVAGTTGGESLRSLTNTNEKLTRSSYAALSSGGSSQSLPGDQERDEHHRRARTLSEMGDGFARATFSPPLSSSPRVSKQNRSDANDLLRNSGKVSPSAPQSSRIAINFNSMIAKEPSKSSPESGKANISGGRTGVFDVKPLPQDNSVLSNFKVVALRPSEVSNFFGRYSNRKKNGVVLSPIKETSEEDPQTPTAHSKPAGSEDKFDEDMIDNCFKD